jgi:hypothetical protein
LPGKSQRADMIGRGNTELALELMARSKPGAVGKAKCDGTDALSGIATCTLTVHSVKKGKTQTITYQATATDRAGNTATVKGTYIVKP